MDAGISDETGSISNMNVNSPAPRGPASSLPPRPATTDPRRPRPSVNTGQPSSLSQAPPAGASPNSFHSTPQSAVEPPLTPTAANTRNAPSSQPNDFGSCLTKLIESHTVLVMKQQEKESLEKESAYRQRYLNKAMALSLSQRVPASMQFYQLSTESDDARIRKLNKELSEQTAISRQLTDALQKHGLPALPESDQISSLRAELKAEVDALKQSTSETPQSPMPIEGQMAKLATSLNKQSQNNRKLESQIGELAQWRSDFEEGNAKFPASLFPNDIKSLERDLKSAQEQCQEAEINIKRLQEYYSNVKKELEKVASERPSQDFQKTVDGLSVSMSQFGTRLSSMEQSVQRITALETKVDTNGRNAQGWLEQHHAMLNSQDAELKRLAQKVNSTEEGSIATGSSSVNAPTAQTTATVGENIVGGNAPAATTPATNTLTGNTSDNTPSASSIPQKNRDVDQRMNVVESAVSALQGKNDDLESLCRHLSTIVSPIGHKGPTWFALVEKWMQTTDVLQTALRSLELRYNNINTEPMVKKMAHALQEIYPSVPTLTEQVKSLKESQAASLESLKGEIRRLDTNPTRAQVERLEGQIRESTRSVQDAMKEAWAQIQKDIAARIETLQPTPNGVFEQMISDRLGPLQEAQRGESLTNAKNLEEINKLKGEFEISQSSFVNLGELVDKYAEDIAMLNEKVQDLEESDSKLANHELQLQSHGQRIDGVDSSIRNCLDRLDELQAFGTAPEIQSYCEQLRRLKQEDVASKVAKLNDLLAKSIVSCYSEIGQQTLGTNEPPQEPSRASVNGPAPAPKSSNTAQPRQSNANEAQPTALPNSEQPARNLTGPIQTSTSKSSSTTAPLQPVNSGAKRKRSSAAPSESDKQDEQDKQGKKQVPSTRQQVQMNSSPALSDSDQSRKKAKKKERRRQSQLHQ